MKTLPKNPLKYSFDRWRSHDWCVKVWKVFDQFCFFHSNAFRSFMYCLLMAEFGCDITCLNMRMRSPISNNRRQVPVSVLKVVKWKFGKLSCWIYRYTKFLHVSCQRKISWIFLQKFYFGLFNIYFCTKDMKPLQKIQDKRFKAELQQSVSACVFHTFSAFLR